MSYEFHQPPAHRFRCVDPGALCLVRRRAMSLHLVLSGVSFGRGSQGLVFRSLPTGVPTSAVRLCCRRAPLARGPNWAHGLGLGPGGAAFFLGGGRAAVAGAASVLGGAPGAPGLFLVTWLGW
jgi:hypothetical protein